jgi:5-deoxy-D-glucuronate isomerase
MKHYNAENLLVKSDALSDEPGLLLNITPKSADWEYISFQVRTLAAGTPGNLRPAKTSWRW